MRRLLVGFLGLLILSACGEADEASILSAPEEDTAGPEEPGDPAGATDISSGNYGISTDNPHFFFLSPLIDSPSYSGVPEGGLEPVVSVCPRSAWDSDGESCTPEDETARFSGASQDGLDRVTEMVGLGYTVTWDTERYPARAGEVYRVGVYVLGQLLGFVDVQAFQGAESCQEDGREQRECDTRPYDPAVGYAAFYHQGILEITFRIEEGAVESEYCDSSGVEDCDVELFTHETGGCLRVYENPGQTGELLGSQACVPGGAAEMDGAPVEGFFAVILTLEQEGVFQGSGDGVGQVPFFPDLRTDPPGITFDPDVGGVDVVICQAVEGPGTVPADLHPSLRPFAFYPDGSVSLPRTFAYGAPECEGFEPHSHARSVHGEDEGGPFLDRLASGFRHVSRLLLPSPLHAFRLHGGLNTTVYSTRGDLDRDEDDGEGGDDGDGEDDGEGDGENNGPARSGARADDSPTHDLVVELGAILDVDASASSAAVPEFGAVGTETSILINARNALGEPFPFELRVEVEIEGANPETMSAQYLGQGQYTASYVPQEPGVDEIRLDIDGRHRLGPFTSTVSPTPADAGKTTFQLSPSEVGAVTEVRVFVADENGAPYLHEKSFPVEVEVEVRAAGTLEPLQTLQARDRDAGGGYDGVYRAVFTPDDFGAYDISVKVNGEATPDSPRRLVTDPLPADPERSYFLATEGVVDSPTTVTVYVFNTAGAPYTYGDYRPVEVRVWVTGANQAEFSALDPELEGAFAGSYTPTAPGTDEISVTIDGVQVPGTLTSEVQPLSGGIEVALEFLGSAPADGLPVELYRPGETAPLATIVTDAAGVARFPTLDFGEYVAHLPRRDFDVRVDEPSVPVVHDEGNTRVVIGGVTQSLPSTAVVWRIRDGGTGNAYQYRTGTRSWGSARAQAGEDRLLGFDGHLATLTSFAENEIIRTLYRITPDLCPGNASPQECKILGWIGLSDEESEGAYQWVTGETFSFDRWAGGFPPQDPTGEEDYVRIDVSGFWSVGGDPASPALPAPGGPQRVFEEPPSVEGYFVEWESLVLEGPAF